MTHRIDDETIEYVEILAKLKLSEPERKEAKKDMGRMLDYIDKLNELDTAGVEPMSHVLPLANVFREDTVKEDGPFFAGFRGHRGYAVENALKNAPEQKNGAFKVPKTVE